MAKKHFYVVWNGRKNGIYLDWEECEKQVSKFSNAGFKKCSTMEEAQALYHEKTGNVWKAGGENKTVEPEKTTSYIEEDTSAESYEPADTTCHLMEKLRKKVQKVHDNPSSIPKSVVEYCKKNPFARRLSVDQQRALGQLSGHSLLFAVPGSGKTTVIVSRIGYLLHGNHGRHISPDSVITLTFGKKAAEEMRTRYEKNFHDSTDDHPDFRTIHSFCYNKILKPLKLHRYPVPKHLMGETIEITDDKKKKKQCPLTNKFIFRKVLKTIDIKIALDEEDCDFLATVIGWIKNRMLSPEEYETRHLTFHTEKISIRDFFNAYESVMHRYDAYDFDDMLRLSYEGLKSHKELLESIQNQYRYWNIDESQDNSPLQNQLLKLLVGDNGVLFMVGDDDQSIYGFRGAEPRQLLAYGIEDATKIMVMGKNYRSASKIVNTARRFIEQNNIRADKEMIAHQKILGQIDFYTWIPTPAAEYQHIVERAHRTWEKALKARHSVYDDGGPSLAVLYRVNVSSIPLAYWLKRSKIPFDTSKSLAETLRGKVISEGINWMRFLFRTRHNVAAYKSIKSHLVDNYLISDDDWKFLEEKEKPSPKLNFYNLVKYLSHKYDKEEEFADLLASITKVDKLLNKVKNKSTFAIFKELIQEHFIHVDIGKQGERVRAYALLSAAEAWPDPKEFLAVTDEIRIEARTSDDIDKTNEEYVAELQEDVLEKRPKEEELKPAVHLLTMHAAKGKEFDEVILSDLIEPTEVNLDSSELMQVDNEENRRLFYVAMTRAKKHLEFMVVQSYYGNYENPLGFVKEVAECYEDETGSPILQQPQKGFDDKLNEASECVLQPEKYYAVRIGKKPGIYESWYECSLNVTGVPGAKYKSFTSRTEAAAYLDIKLSAAEDRLKLSFLNKIADPTGTITFNGRIDLPSYVYDAIGEILHVKDMRHLTDSECDIIKSQVSPINFFGKNVINYHGRALSYTLSYMPLNFYKSWRPLSYCVRKDLLPEEMSVLELGPGPGTTTASILSFYQKLAAENPNRHYHLQYEAIENEPDFIAIFSPFVKSVIAKIERMTPNLKISGKIRHADVFSVMPQMPSNHFNLIVESNVFNEKEGLQSSQCQHIIKEIERCLQQHGIFIFIEPTSHDCKNPIQDALPFSSLHTLEGPRPDAVEISGISLVNTAERLGLRSKKTLYHRFVYAVVQK